MNDINEILCKEIDAIILENADRLDKAIEHIKLEHDPILPKTHMRNCRTLEFKVTFHGKIND